MLYFQLEMQNSVVGFSLPRDQLFQVSHKINPFVPSFNSRHYILARVGEDPELNPGTKGARQEYTMQGT